MNTKKTSLTSLKLNDNNPRIIKDYKFGKLVKSLLTFPEMLTLRPIVANRQMLVLGGNMRLRALLHISQMTEQELTQTLKKYQREDLMDWWLAWHDKPMVDYLSAEDLTDEQQKEFIIKDNVGYGEWEWDMLANEWDMDALSDWGVDMPIDWGTSIGGSRIDDDVDGEYEQKKREFEERMAAGEDVEEDEEYKEFLKKFELKKTTDDCYTPELIYNAVVEWVEKKYNVSRKNFVRPFYPGGDYKNYDYPADSIVVDNPPFSILAKIIQFYDKNNINFFLFAPSLTLFSSSSSSSCAICVDICIIYANGAKVNTSFLTNLGDKSVRFCSAPELYKMLYIANTENLKSMRKELPKYTYPDNIVTSTFVGRLSKYGIDYSVSVKESEPISALEYQKKEGKSIYGKGYIISEKAAAEKAAAEKAAAEKAAAEKVAATRWRLSDKEREIIRKLSLND